MLQHIRKNYSKSDKALYISVDSPYFQAHNLFEFAKEFYQTGGEVLLIDEVHKYQKVGLFTLNQYMTLFQT